ncbi:helix-turn-helix domain-containing protein [Cellulomonas iranensis]|uniref:helix-turn-helix domain-containing protein n=1 Tax=Cellulomonas iranensis TaxID=76862 RepID=UPI0009EA9478
MNSSPRQPLLTVADVARQLGVHPETARKLARQGRIRAAKFGGRTSPYRFRQSAVDEFIAMQEARIRRGAV